MKHMSIISEGQSECFFVKEVLSQHLLAHQWMVRPITLRTGRSAKGGWRSSDGYQNAIKQIYNTMVTEKDVDLFTTIFDLYGFPADIACYQEAKKLNNPYAKADLYAQQIKDDVQNYFAKQNDSTYNEKKFLPYVQPYEFEAFLFVDANISALELSDDEPQFERLNQEIQSVIENYETPEHINGHLSTAPSKRMEALVPGFAKNKAGRAGFSWRIAKEVGLEEIRRKCLHFNRWLETMERFE